MTTPNLAKIERVDLREAWPNEARDFTPWLAENIAELGEALGMDLELQETEAAVGGYSLDVLATDLNQNRPVIIENQLEPTNHTHLGQLLTYAAGYDANVIVWLTREFRDEHRQALDWLNQRTGEDTEFFGVVVELLKIDGSRPAPQFRTVATPNEWRKMQGRSTPSTPSQELNYEWRRGLIEILRQKHGFSFRRIAQAKSTWLAIERPITDAWYAVSWDKGNPCLELRLHKRGSGGRDWNQKIFESLEQHKGSIEAKILESEHSEQFIWESTERRQISRVAICRDGNVFQDTESWDEYRDWLIGKFLRFREVFRPFLQEFSQQEQQTIE